MLLLQILLFSLLHTNNNLKDKWSPCCKSNKLEIYNLNIILKELKLKYDEFVELCIPRKAIAPEALDSGKVSFPEIKW